MLAVSKLTVGNPRYQFLAIHPFIRITRRSKRRLLALTLHLCRFYPPHQIVGKARKRPFEGLAAFAHRRTIGREGLFNGANGNCA